MKQRKLIRTTALLCAALLLVSCSSALAEEQLDDTMLAAVAAQENTMDNEETESASTKSKLKQSESKKEKISANTPNEDTVTALPEEVQLPVENILQIPALPNGCEVVSLSIVLNYLGYEVDSTFLSDNFLPQGVFGQTDPEFTYVGDPRGAGLGCYTTCILITSARYLNSIHVSGITTRNLNGSTPEELKAWIAKGWPVILWATVDMNGFTSIAAQWTVNGQDVYWHANSHCVVISGYTADTYTICDPLRGVVTYSKEEVELAYALNGCHAAALYEQEISNAFEDIS